MGKHRLASIHASSQAEYRFEGNEQGVFALNFFESQTHRARAAQANSVTTVKFMREQHSRIQSSNYVEILLKPNTHLLNLLHDFLMVCL